MKETIEGWIKEAVAEEHHLVEHIKELLSLGCYETALANNKLLIRTAERKKDMYRELSKLNR